MTTEAIRPLAIDLERGAALRVRWADGHVSEYPLAYLRRSCPCATCRHEREESSRNALKVLKVAPNVQQMTTADSAELVGHYALRVTWRDGHDLGIFDYATLRALCPCKECMGRRNEA